MGLYSYKKSENSTEYSEFVVLNDYKKIQKNEVKVSGIYQGLKDLAHSSKIANIIVPGIFIVAGVLFIYKEVFPEIQQNIQKNSGYLALGNVSPVNEGYIDLSKYISRPVDFPALTAAALKEGILQKDDTSLNFNETFYISIPALGMNRLPVQPNVDSSSEANYLPVLETKLAHFKNTGLPISNIDNNMLIYGHSASPNYGPQASDPYVAFSFLPKLQVGDDISIEIAGKTYKYKMSKSKIVAPTDTSVITGTYGKETLTLVTCFPLGSNESRYVAIARPVD